jgi:hypothetical protein
MPKTYARITDNTFAELILPAFYDAEHPDRQEGEPSRIGLEIPIEERFTAEIVATLIDITDIIPQPQPNWTYVDGVFAPAVVPTVDPILAIIARMVQIDALSVKFLRKIAADGGSQQDKDILVALEDEYANLEASL